MREVTSHTTFDITDALFAVEPNPVAMLVCEGACNPAIDKLDTDVRATIKDRIADALNGGMDPPADERLVARLRALVHTPHTGHAGGSRFKCAVCGHFRRFGGGLA